MPSWLEVLIAVIAVAGGGSGIAAIISAISSRRTARNAARQADVDALTTTIKTLILENQRLCQRVENLDRDLAAARLMTSQLSDKIDLLETENGKLKARIGELERENCELRKMRRARS
jgi:predicted nuclease with TOPRIM domain